MTGSQILAKDRQRYGSEVEYFTLWNSGEVKKTGIWDNGRLINGTVYNVILNKKNKLYIIGDV